MLSCAVCMQKLCLNNSADMKPLWKVKARVGCGPYPGPTPPPGSKYGGLEN